MNWLGCDGGLVDRVSDSGPYDASSNPFGERKIKINEKEAVVGPCLKKRDLVTRLIKLLQ